MPSCKAGRRHSRPRIPERRSALNRSFLRRSSRSASRGLPASTSRQPSWHGTWQSGTLRIVGRAYVDTHIVRTKRESLLISLEADGRVKGIDVTAFQEPMEYLPPAPWLAQHEGRLLSEDLRMHRLIRPIAGATLSATAVTDSTRRVLAIDQTLESAVPTPKAPR